VRWTRNRKREWRDHGWQRLQKRKNQIHLDLLDDHLYDGMKAGLQHPNCSWLTIDENTGLRPNVRGRRYLDLER